MKAGDWDVALNVDNFYLKHLDGITPNEHKITQILIFDHKLSEINGYTIAFSNEVSNDNGSANNTFYQSMDISYTYNIGLMRIYAAANTSSAKDDDVGTTTKTQFGVGMSAHFK